MTFTSVSHLVVDAAFRRPTHRRPVWMMRQAGRYLPEYHEVRNRAGDFLTLCKTPELAAEVSLQPYKRFKVDAVIVFNDILVVPEAMGMELIFTDQGPKLPKPIRSTAALDALRVPEEGEGAAHVLETLRMLRHDLHDEVPLVGFAGGPWTLATYMVEGGGSREFEYIKSILYSRPDALHRLLQKLADTVTSYLTAQVRAGAQVLQIFDTWASTLQPDEYRAFALPYVQQIVRGVREAHSADALAATTGASSQVAGGGNGSVTDREADKPNPADPVELPPVPIIYYTNGGAGIFDDITEIGADCVSIDWRTDLGFAKQMALSRRVAVQGNLDPCVLLGTQDTIEKHVRRMLDTFGRAHGYIGNLGHGILKHTPPDNAGFFIKRFQELSQGYSSI